MRFFKHRLLPRCQVIHNPDDLAENYEKLSCSRTTLDGLVALGELCNVYGGRAESNMKRGVRRVRGR